MTETRLDVSGSTEEAQRSIDKLVKKTAQLTEQLRTMKETSKQGAKVATEAHEGLAVSIGKAAAKVTSLGALVGTAYGDWARRLDDIAKRHDELATKMSKGLGESGTMERAAPTKDWLSKMNKEGVTKDHALSALEQVSKAGDLSPERQLELAGEAGKFGKTGADVGKLGRLAAEIDKASGGQMSSNDVNRLCRTTIVDN
jgi:methyl-accepting chemotaxis protein